jgi:hypothetical protein
MKLMNIRVPRPSERQEAIHSFVVVLNTTGLCRSSQKRRISVKKSRLGAFSTVKAAQLQKCFQKINGLSIYAHQLRGRRRELLEFLTDIVGY